MNPVAEFHLRTGETAVLDSAHLGDIRRALGTIRRYDIAPRRGWWTRLRTLLAILGPGLIVMVGDNDAGAFGTYTQAGQDYGTTLRFRRSERPSVQLRNRRQWSHPWAPPQTSRPSWQLP